MSGPERIPGGLDPGVAAELSVRHIGAGWGLPDFVFAPGEHQTSSGRREVSDGIILCGPYGVVLQTKCRTSPGDNVDRERTWIETAARDATRQASGTLRTLRSSPKTMTSLRGVPYEILADRYQWLCVIIIDHDNPPDEPIANSTSKDPAIVLLKSDWDFLFNHLRSTFAVVRYLRYVVQLEGVALGSEWVRFGQIAYMSSLEPESTVDPRLLMKGAVKYHAPILSLTPAMEDDASAQAFYRMLLDEVAVTMLSDPELAGEPRLVVLAHLDALPVSMRSTVARFLLDSITEVSKDVGGGVKWLTRTIRGTADGTQLLFGACSSQFDGFNVYLRNWVVVRHHDLREDAGAENCETTLALVLTPCINGRRPWEITICSVAGDVELDPVGAQATRDRLAMTRSVVPRRAAAKAARRHRRSRRRE